MSTIYFDVEQHADLTAAAGTPQSAQVLQPFAQPLQVLVKDEAGQPLPNTLVTFTQQYAPPYYAMANLSSMTATTNDQGIASVTATANGYGGSYSIIATTAGASAPVTFALTNSGTPTHMQIVGGSAQSTPILAAFPNLLQVRVTDNDGNPTSGVPVTFTPEYGPPNYSALALLSSQTVTTDSNGIASVAASANGYSGFHTVIAAAPGVIESPVFTLSNHGAGSQIYLHGGNNQAAQFLNTFAAPLEVLVTDDVGTPASGVQVNFTTQYLPPNYSANAVLGSTTAITDSTGVARISVSANGYSGDHAVIATIDGTSASITFSLRNHGAANRFGPATGTPQSAKVLAGFATPLEVLVTDDVGSPASGTVVTFAVPSSGASASLSRYTVTTGPDGKASVTAIANGQPGMFEVTASFPGATTTSSFALTNLPPGPSVTAISPATGPASGATAVTITGAVFTGATAVTIGGVAVDSFHINSDTSISTITPAGVAGVASVEVTGPSGTSDLNTLFRYVPSPILVQDVPSTILVVNQAATPFTPVTVAYSAGQPTFSLSGGSLPAGLQFSETTGQISGKPTEVISDTEFTVTVTDQSTPPTNSNSATFRLEVEALEMTMTTSGEAQTCPSGTLEPLQVTLKDQFGNPVPGITVDFQSNQGTLTANSVTTDSNGVASVRIQDFTRTFWSGIEFYPHQDPNVITVYARVPGTQLQEAFNISFTGICETVSKSEFKIISGNDQSATVQNDFEQVLEIEVAKISDRKVILADEYVPGGCSCAFTIYYPTVRTVLPNVRVRFVAPDSGATGILSITEVVTDANGIARLPVKAGEIPGSYAITAILDETTLGFVPFNTAPNLTFRLTNGPALPEVSAINPAMGPLAGGTLVTLTGKGFTGATSVSIGGAEASDVTLVDDSTLTAITPPGTVGTASVVVTTPAGGNAANTLFSYAVPLVVPSVTAVNPATGPLSGGTLVTLTGSGFTEATTVTIGGAAVTDLVVVDDITITAKTPAGTLGAASVVVTIPTGSNAANSLYTYIKSPQIVAFSSAAPTAAVVGDSYTPSATGGGSTSPVVIAVSGPCTITAGVVTFDVFGECIITADQAGDDNYEPAAQVQQVVSIGKAPQILSFTTAAPTGAVVGGSYTPAATGGGSTSPVVIGVSGSCSIAAGVVSFDAVGECMVTADRAGDDNHEAAPQVQQSFDITAANARPIADAGSSQNVNAEETVVLDGSGSADPDAEALAYSWTQTEGTSVALIDAASATPSFVAPSLTVGDADLRLEFSLIVTDSRGLASEPSTVIITVMAPKAAATVLVRVNTSSDEALPADDQAEAEITVVLMDSDGNQLPFGGNSVTATTNLGTLRRGTDMTSRQLNASDGGAYTFFLRSGTPGVATVSVTVDGTKADPVQVTFAMIAVPSISGETQDRIAGFMLGRADSLATNQPGLARFLTGSDCGQMNAKASDGSSSYDGCFARGNTWAEITSSRSDAASYSLGTVGIHHLINPDLLMGVMVQFDHTEDTANRVSGKGWMLGPYFAAQLNGQPFFIEGRLLLGQSQNEIDPLGLYTDRFETTRLLAQLEATGEYELPKVTLRPNLALSYAKDKQLAYVDSLSNPIPGQKVSLFQIDAGLDFAMPLPVQTGRMDLTGGLSGIYSATTAAMDADMRARAHLGLSYNSGKGTNIEFGGFHDGLGTSMRSYGASLSFQMEF